VYCGGGVEIGGFDAIISLCDVFPNQVWELIIIISKD